MPCLLVPETTESAGSFSASSRAQGCQKSGLVKACRGPILLPLYHLKVILKARATKDSCVDLAIQGHGEDPEIQKPVT